MVRPTHNPRFIPAALSIVTAHCPYRWYGNPVNIRHGTPRLAFRRLPAVIAIAIDGYQAHTQLVT